MSPAVLNSFRILRFGCNQVSGAASVPSSTFQGVRSGNRSFFAGGRSNVVATGTGRGSNSEEQKGGFKDRTSKHRDQPEFGIIFDIDGVIVRGKNVLPSAPAAFRRLMDDVDKFRVPTAFVTNAGNSLRKSKAQQLSRWLGVEIEEDMVVMAHSPLRMFQDYHRKHVLVIGQGRVETIAHSLGFSNVTTMTTLRHAFPTLDAVDHKRRRAPPCAFERFFPRIEAVVLFGEPIRWETSLQLLLDVLVTNGLPCDSPETYSHPHLPILACNMDLQWMAEAPMPRFGHGAFLLCLENLYKKLTGWDLVYTALVGKPSEITYRHGEHVLQSQALKMGGGDVRSPLKNIYCIGDNVCTDIFGANLYNRYLRTRRGRNGQDDRASRAETAIRSSSNSGRTLAATATVAAAAEKNEHAVLTRSRSIDHLIGAVGELNGASNCFSVLVETGVYNGDLKHYTTLDHSPRDFLPVENSFQEPTFLAKDVADAVDLIFKREHYS